jgi:small nuclear ribonucleoprotein D3
MIVTPQGNWKDVSEEKNEKVEVGLDEEVVLLELIEKSAKSEDQFYCSGGSSGCKCMTDRLQISRKPSNHLKLSTKESVDSANVTDFLLCISVLCTSPAVFYQLACTFLKIVAPVKMKIRLVCTFCIIYVVQFLSVTDDVRLQIRCSSLSLSDFCNDSSRVAATIGLCGVHSKGGEVERRPRLFCCSRMSVVGNNRVGIPIVALHDAEGAVVEVETKNGELIRGLLFEAEDMMNLYIKNAVIVDCATGVKRKSNQVYLQGSNIVLIVLPDMLKHAPMFNR